MKRFMVFDITKPLLSDEAEQEVEAKTMTQAIEKLVELAPGQYIRQVKSGGARFVVYSPDSSRITKRMFDIFIK